MYKRPSPTNYSPFIVYAATNTMLRYSLLIFALILAVVPRVRPEEIPVTVGGIGILKFQPDFVVRVLRFSRLGVY